MCVYGADHRRAQGEPANVSAKGFLLRGFLRREPGVLHSRNRFTICSSLQQFKVTIQDLHINFRIFTFHLNSTRDTTND